MFIYLLIYIICVVTILVVTKKTHIENQIIKFDHLNNYINQENKNCKIKYKILKNNTKSTDNNNNICKINKKYKYKKLKKTYLCLDYFLIQDDKYSTYVERLNRNINIKIFNIAKNIDLKIDNCKEKFRAVNNQCIVETIAASYAHAILVEKNFNVFKAFKQLSSETKIYKKEAHFLKILIIANLINIYNKLQNDIIKIKTDVINGKHSFFFIKNPTYANIYGIYLLNKSSAKLLIKKNLDIITATNHVLNELDDIYFKQRIIYNYIKFLY